MARVIERVARPRRLADIRHDPWLQAAAKRQKTRIAYFMVRSIE